MLWIEDYYFLSLLYTILCECYGLRIIIFFPCYIQYYVDVANVFILLHIHSTISVDTHDYYITTVKGHQVYCCCFYGNTCTAECRHLHEMLRVQGIFNY